MSASVHPVNLASFSLAATLENHKNSYDYLTSNYATSSSYNTVLNLLNKQASNWQTNEGLGWWACDYLLELLQKYSTDDFNDELAFNRAVQSEIQNSYTKRVLEYQTALPRYILDEFYQTYDYELRVASISDVEYDVMYNAYDADYRNKIVYDFNRCVV